MRRRFPVSKYEFLALSISVAAFLAFLLFPLILMMFPAYFYESFTFRMAPAYIYLYRGLTFSTSGAAFVAFLLLILSRRRRLASKHEDLILNVFIVAFVAFLLFAYYEVNAYSFLGIHEYCYPVRLPTFTIEGLDIETAFLYRDESGAVRLAVVVRNIGYSPLHLRSVTLNNLEVEIPPGTEIPPSNYYIPKCVILRLKPPGQPTLGKPYFLTVTASTELDPEKVVTASKRFIPTSIPEWIPGRVRRVISDDEAVRAAREYMRERFKSDPLMRSYFRWRFENAKVEGYTLKGNYMTIIVYLDYEATPYVRYHWTAFISDNFRVYVDAQLGFCTGWELASRIEKDP